MFGRESVPLDGEIDVAEFDFLRDAHEFARLWAQPQGPMTCIIDPHALGPDPFLFGMAMVDAVRHGAKAYAQALNIPEEDILARIWEGLDAERGNPTDTPRQINPEGRTN